MKLACFYAESHFYMRPWIFTGLRNSTTRSPLLQPSTQISLRWEMDQSKSPFHLNKALTVHKLGSHNCLQHFDVLICAA